MIREMRHCSVKRQEEEHRNGNKGLTSGLTLQATH